MRAVEDTFDKTSTEITTGYSTLVELLRDGEPVGRRLLQWLGRPSPVAATMEHAAAGAVERPIVHYTGMEAPQLAAIAWGILRSLPQPVVFRRGRGLVYVARTASGGEARVLDVRGLQVVLAAAMQFVRVRELKDGRHEAPTYAPPDLAAFMLVNIPADVPILERVATAPFFADASTLVADAGYHAPSCTWLDGAPWLDAAAAVAPPSTSRRRALRCSGSAMRYWGSSLSRARAT